MKKRDRVYSKHVSGPFHGLGVALSTQASNIFCHPLVVLYSSVCWLESRAMVDGDEQIPEVETPEQ